MRKKVSFVLMLAIVAAMVIGIMLPSAAVAAPGIVEANWSEAVFEGTDAFYGTSVVAYTAGSTAKLEFRVNNDSAADIKITGGRLVFDWGTCTPTVPATFPFVLASNSYAIFRFECVVPADASNQTLYSYRAIVTYEGDNGPVKVNEVYWQDVPGAGVTYALVNAPIVPDSEVIYLEDTVTNIVTPLALNSGYAINDYTGVITFTAAPTANVRAKYKYCEDVIAGDGSTLVGYLAHVPVVAGSLIVCREDSVAETITVLAATTDYTFNPANGKLTMVTAPTAWQTITAYYNYYSEFTYSGANFAVVSADQANYLTAWSRYDETYDTYWLSITSGEARLLAGQADQARAQAETEYSEGKFASAAATMQTALTTFNAALAAEAEYQGAINTGITGLLTGAGGAIDAYGNKLQAEANNINGLTAAQVKKLKGEASMSANLGVFYIMLGVFTLLAGIAGIIWSFSRYVAAKGPKQL